MRILVVDDSPRLVRAVASGLRRAGHAVDTAPDGLSGLSYARLNPYDAVVLDLMLPGRDGLQVLAELRDAGSDTPVLVLTARDSVEDRVRGLRAGADDCLVKPFAFDELLARLEALERRRSGRAHAIIQVWGLRIDTNARRATYGGRTLSLPAREYSLLVLLASRQGETVTRIEIEDHLYGESNFPMSNAVSSAICGLRARLAAAGCPRLIHTRRGLGYVLDEEPP